MIEFLLLLVAVGIGLAISTALERAGARDRLPAPMQRTYQRTRPVVVARDRG